MTNDRIWSLSSKWAIPAKPGPGQPDPGPAQSSPAEHGLAGTNPDHQAHTWPAAAPGQPDSSVPGPAWWVMGRAGPGNMASARVSSRPALQNMTFTRMGFGAHQKYEKNKKIRPIRNMKNKWKHINIIWKKNMKTTWRQPSLQGAVSCRLQTPCIEKCRFLSCLRLFSGSFNFT